MVFVNGVGAGLLGTGMLRRHEIGQLIRNGNINNHENSYALAYLVQRNLLTRVTIGAFTYYTTTPQATQPEGESLQHVRERMMDSIMFYFNDPLQAGRQDITRRQVAHFCNRHQSNPAFRASFNELLRRGSIRPTPGHRNRFRL